MSDEGVLLPHGVRLLPSGNMVVFGYGDHPSTRRCLDWLEAELGAGDTVADVGTGTGILAIKAALLGAARVVCYEADLRLHDLIAANIAANGVGDRVELRGAFPETWDGERTDLLVANVGADSLAYEWGEYADQWYDDHRAEAERPQTRMIEVPADAIVEYGPDGSLVIRPREA